MPRNYSRNTFLRQTPNRMLKEHFATKGLFGEVDLEGLRETEIEPIAQAMNGLGDRQREEVEAEFAKVYEMACSLGVQVLIEEATSPSPRENSPRCSMCRSDRSGDSTPPASCPGQSVWAAPSGGIARRSRNGLRLDARIATHGTRERRCKDESGNDTGRHRGSGPNHIANTILSPLPGEVNRH